MAAVVDLTDLWKSRSLLLIKRQPYLFELLGIG
jgi:hypothetical protein